MSERKSRLFNESTRWAFAPEHSYTSKTKTKPTNSPGISTLKYAIFDLTLTYLKLQWHLKKVDSYAGGGLWTAWELVVKVERV